MPRTSASQRGIDTARPTRAPLTSGRAWSRSAHGASPEPKRTWRWWAELSFAVQPLRRCSLPACHSPLYQAAWRPLWATPEAQHSNKGFTRSSDQGAAAQHVRPSGDRKRTFGRTGRRPAATGLHRPQEATEITPPGRRRTGPGPGSYGKRLQGRLSCPRMAPGV